MSPSLSLQSHHTHMFPSFWPSSFSSFLFHNKLYNIYIITLSLLYISWRNYLIIRNTLYMTTHERWIYTWEEYHYAPMVSPILSSINRTLILPDSICFNFQVKHKKKNLLKVTLSCKTKTNEWLGKGKRALSLTTDNWNIKVVRSITIEIKVISIFRHLFAPILGH